MDFTTFHGSGEIPDGKKRILSEEGEKKKKQRERGKENEKECCQRKGAVVKLYLHIALRSGQCLKRKVQEIHIFYVR